MFPQFQYHLIWFSTSLPNFCHKYISVDVPIHLGISFDANEAMFLAVIKPMSCAARSNNSLKLIGLHPNDLFNTFITPQLQTARCYKGSHFSQIQVNRARKDKVFGQRFQHLDCLDTRKISLSFSFDPVTY